MLIAVPTGRIPAAWASLIDILRPSVERDQKRTSWDLLDALMGDRMTAWVVEGEGIQGAIVTRIDHLDNVTPPRKVGWVYYAAGAVTQRREARAQMREVLHEFEDVARFHGCHEVRFGGRAGWAAIAGGYRLLSRSGSQIEMMKVL